MTPDSHVARQYTFEPRLVPHINWQSLGTEAVVLAAHLDATRQDDGSVTVTIYWSRP